MPELHLSRTELTEWRDGGAGDRERIVGHLAACAACREVAADVERNRPADTPPQRFEADDFIARGYRSGGRGAARPSARRWLWVAVPAALLALALVPMWLARLDDRSTTMRGETPLLVPVHPMDVAVTPDELTFEWQGTSGTDRVRLNVVSIDRPGEPLIDREVTGSRYEPTSEERRRFQPGQSLHWYVEARGGTAGGTSPAARFRVR